MASLRFIDFLEDRGAFVRSSLVEPQYLQTLVALPREMVSKVGSVNVKEFEHLKFEKLKHVNS